MKEGSFLGLRQAYALQDIFVYRLQFHAHIVRPPRVEKKSTLFDAARDAFSCRSCHGW